MSVEDARKLCVGNEITLTEKDGTKNFAIVTNRSEDYLIFMTKEANKDTGITGIIKL